MVGQRPARLDLADLVEVQSVACAFDRHVMLPARQPKGHHTRVRAFEPRRAEALRPVRRLGAQPSEQPDHCPVDRHEDCRAGHGTPLGERVVDPDHPAGDIIGWPVRFGAPDAEPPALFLGHPLQRRGLLTQPPVDVTRLVLLVAADRFVQPQQNFVGVLRRGHQRSRRPVENKGRPPCVGTFPAHRVGGHAFVGQVGPSVAEIGRGPTSGAPDQAARNFNHETESFHMSTIRSFPHSPLGL